MTRAIPIEAGDRFGLLTALEPRQRGVKAIKMRCDCGNVIEAAASSVVTHNTESCGCKRAETLRKRAAATTSKRVDGSLNGRYVNPANRPGYVSWSPKPHVRRRLQQALEVFREYEAHRPLTIRQVFYRLVGAHGYPKTEKACNRLQYALKRARRAELIPFDWLRDDGITGTDPGKVYADVESPEEWLDRYLRGLRHRWTEYGIPRATGQPRRVEVHCEAAGMHGQLARVVAPYGWPVFSGGGAESITCRRDVVDRCARQPEFPTVVLHVGDFDPAGEDIFNAFRRDVTAFLAEDAPDAELRFVRVAVTPEQIAAHNLPTAPPKTANGKAQETIVKRWHANGHGETCQAEALPPNALAEIVEHAVREHTDLDVLAVQQDREMEAREWLRTKFEERFGEASDA